MTKIGIDPYAMENKKGELFGSPFRDSAGSRTQDPYIKSVLLYQLSYRIKTNLKSEGRNLKDSFFIFRISNFFFGCLFPKALQKYIDF
jgi:hypothetical protein